MKLTQRLVIQGHRILNWTVSGRFICLAIRCQVKEISLEIKRAKINQKLDNEEN